MKSIVLPLIAAFSILAGPASAQQSGEVTLYSGTNYTGMPFTLTGTRYTVDVPFKVRSVRIVPGEQWQLCTRDELRSCVTFRSSDRYTSITVRSASPIPYPVRPPIIPPMVLPPVQSGESLRGMASEYFPRPQIRGQRVLSGSTAYAAEVSARNFCRQTGWSRAEYQLLETVGGRNYLADVLCVGAMR